MADTRSPSRSTRAFAALSGLSGLLCACVARAQEAGTPKFAPADGDGVAGALAGILAAFERGGPIMWTVVGVLALGVAVGVERLMSLTRRKHVSRDFQKDALHVADLKGMDAAMGFCRERPSSLARVISAALLRHGAPLSQLESAVRNETRLIHHSLLKNTRIIGWLAAIVPIQGLLGVLLCMHQRLDFDEAGQRATALGNGLADGLPCLTLALVAALILLGFYFITRARADDIAQELEILGVDAVVILDRKARQSIRLVEDLEDNIKTESMIKVPDLSDEFEDAPHAGESSLKTAVTTHAGEPVKDDAGKK